jgi:branched-chain amino acid aminotransferase
MYWRICGKKDMPASSLAPVPGAAPAVERGVGFFETLLLTGSRVILREQHIRRLTESLKRFELPAPTREEIDLAIANAVAGSGQGESALRLTWLAIGHDLDDVSAWRLDASVRPIPPTTIKRRNGCEAISLPASFRRDMPEIKSTSYLAAVLGLRRAMEHACDEAFFTASDGSLVEGVATSLVAWDGGMLTASKHLALPGVTAAAMVGADMRRGVLSRELVRRGAIVVGSLTKAAPLLAIDGQLCDTPQPMIDRIQSFNQQMTEGLLG